MVNIAGCKPTYRMVPLSDLKLADSPRPTAQLVASIRQHGLFEDIVVRPWRDRYKVVAGNRRLRALLLIAQEDELDLARQMVPCKVEEDPERALACLVATNNLGKRNPLADCDAIVSYTDRLMKKGMTVSDITKTITKELKLSAATQAKRLKLRGLPLPTREALMDGRISVSSAERLHSLSNAQVQEISRILEEGGRCTAKDIQRYRQTGIVEEVNRLGLFPVAVETEGGAACD